MRRVKFPLTWLVKVYASAAAVLVVLTLGFSQAVTVMQDGQRAAQRHRVIVDAGHGGEDGGASSASGVLESGLNLEFAIRLGDLLNFLGYDVTMVRTTDKSVYTQGNTIAEKKVSDLKNRVALVNGTDNALLISIHQNFYPDGRYSGAQVFSCKDEASKALAERLQTMLVQTVNPGSRRRAKVAEGVYLMEKITKPGILVECGFLSSEPELALLRDKSYQQKICCVIAAAAAEFLHDS